MKRIIALYGRGNCGKTTTLNFLKELLREAGQSISSTSHAWQDVAETFMYKGNTICVATRGDNTAEIQNNILYFDSKQPDIAITASRTQKGSADAIGMYGEEIGVHVDWLKMPYVEHLDSATQETVDKAQAKFILQQIDIMLGSL